MILFCMFCCKEPKLYEHSGDRVVSISCCGVSVRMPQGADHRWNKIQRSLSERSAHMFAKRVRRKQAKKLSKGGE